MKSKKLQEAGLLSLVRVRLCTSRKIINTKNILLKWIITSTVHLQSLPYTLNIIYKNEKSYNEWERARIIRPTVLQLARPLALVRAFPHFHQAISFLLSIYYSESFVFSSLFFFFSFNFFPFLSFYGCGVYFVYFIVFFSYSAGFSVFFFCFSILTVFHYYFICWNVHHLFLSRFLYTVQIYIHFEENLWENAEKQRQWW